jgi:hypothetical protein
MNAPQDPNFVSGKLALLNTDASIVIPIAINESNGGMKINTTDTVQFTMTPLAPEDENYNRCMLFVGTDGLTYPFVCDSEGKVLVDL